MFRRAMFAIWGLLMETAFKKKLGYCAMKDTVNPVYCTFQSMYGGDTVRILVTYLYSFTPSFRWRSGDWGASIGESAFIQSCSCTPGGAWDATSTTPATP